MAGKFQDLITLKKTENYVSYAHRKSSARLDSSMKTCYRHPARGVGTLIKRMFYCSTTFSVEMSVSTILLAHGFAKHSVFKVIFEVLTARDFISLL